MNLQLPVSHKKIQTIRTHWLLECLWRDTQLPTLNPQRSILNAYRNVCDWLDGVREEAMPADAKALAVAWAIAGAEIQEFARAAFFR